MSAGGGPVLSYGTSRPAPRGDRLAMVAFVWALCAPATVAGLVYVLGEGMIDIDDLLPRDAVLAVFGAVGLGVPFSAIVIGGIAGARSPTRGRQWLAAGAVLLGALWCVMAGLLLHVVANA